MAYNDTTGDEIKSKLSSKKYEDNWEVIFGKKSKNLPGLVEEKKDLKAKAQWNFKETSED